MKQSKSNHVLVSQLAISAWILKLGETQSALFQPSVLRENNPESQKLEQRLSEIQHNSRCVRRAVKLMLFLTGFAIVAVGHTTVLMPGWPQTLQQFFMYWPVKASCVLGLASLSCAIAFSGLGLFYRRELSRHDDECRRLSAIMVESNEPRIIPLPADARPGAIVALEDPDFFRDAA